MYSGSRRRARSRESEHARELTRACRHLLCATMPKRQTCTRAPRLQQRCNSRWCKLSFLSLFLLLTPALPRLSFCPLQINSPTTTRVCGVHSGTMASGATSKCLHYCQGSPSERWAPVSTRAVAIGMRVRWTCACAHTHSPSLPPSPHPPPPSLRTRDFAFCRFEHL